MGEVEEKCLKLCNRVDCVKNQSAGLITLTFRGNISSQSTQYMFEQIAVQQAQDYVCLSNISEPEPTVDGKPNKQIIIISCSVAAGVLLIVVIVIACIYAKAKRAKTEVFQTLKGKQFRQSQFVDA